MKLFSCMRSLLLPLSLAFAFLEAESSWETFREETVALVRFLPRGCSDDLSRTVMEIIRKSGTMHCVGLGAFKKGDLFLLARALQGAGSLKVIETWNTFDWCCGYPISSPGYQTWKSMDLMKEREEFCALLSKYDLEKRISIVRKTPEGALSLFLNESIDFLYLDGRYSEERLFHAVTSYFSKVKEEGFILFNKKDAFKTMRTLIFLLERADIVTSFTSSDSYVLFQKKKKHEESLRALIKE